MTWANLPPPSPALRRTRRHESGGDSTSLLSKEEEPWRRERRRTPEFFQVNTNGLKRKKVITRLLTLPTASTYTPA